MEESLLTTNLMLDKPPSLDVRVGIGYFERI